MKLTTYRILLFWGLVISLLSTSCSQKQTEFTENQQKLDEYNVVWNSPGKDHHGSMPIGNGEIGLNVWVEESGDICFYIGRTDSWGDNGRLLKVGKVRVKTEPSIVFRGAEFKQTLDLKTGTIKVATKGSLNGEEVEMNFNLWVDANNPAINISHDCSIPVSMKASFELWRTEPYALPEIGVSDLLEDRSKPGRLPQPVIVEPDHVIENTNEYIGWYHHNKKSVGFDITNKLQGLSEFFDEDPILHRTFGAIIKGENAKKVNNEQLLTEASKKGNIQVYVLTKHPAQPEEWQNSIEKLAAEVEETPLNVREKDHKQWWNNFWNRSWLYASSTDETEVNDKDNEAFVVTRAYTLQRFIDASAGRGKFPIKFNGSIFTVPADGKPGDADYRRWGPGYWWQNTRLPYLSMLASGDYDLMQAFFKMYADDLYKLSKLRTKKYFGFDGVYFPECMYFWGSTFTATYGWTPYEEREDKLQESGWHKWEWVSGPELVFMMLDYYQFTGDEKFLTDKIIPIANDIFLFFENHYSKNAGGELVMHPSQALETWWDCTNPMPEVAGLHSICDRLSALPESLTTEEQRKVWRKFKLSLPELPLRDTPSGKALAPATRFENKPNVENPELYAVFPFRQFGVGKPNIEWAKNAFTHRWDKGNFGWRQEELFLTYLGMTRKAKENLVGRASTYDKNSRFPAFWGPNYDWTPDQDHGGVMMRAFQSMLIQNDPYSNTIYLTPAWPKDWNAEFKLHAAQQTIIEGEVKNGALNIIKVSPGSRRKDIKIIEN